MFMFLHSYTIVYLQLNTLIYRICNVNIYLYYVTIKVLNQLVYEITNPCR